MVARSKYVPGSPKNSYARTPSDLVRQRQLINLGYARAMLPDGIARAVCIMLHRVRRLAGSLKALT